MIWWEVIDGNMEWKTVAGGGHILSQIHHQSHLTDYAISSKNPKELGNGTGWF